MSLGRSNDYYQLARYITTIVKSVCYGDEDAAHTAALAAKVLLNDTETIITETYTKFQMNLVFLEFFHLVIGANDQEQRVDIGVEATCFSFFREIFGENNLIISDIYAIVAAARVKQHRLEEAMDYAGKCLVIRMLRLGALDERTAQSHFTLGSIYQQRQMFEDSFKELNICRSIYSKLYGEESLQTANCDIILGQLHLDCGKPRLAYITYQRCYKIRFVLLGANHPKTKHAEQLMLKYRIVHGERIVSSMELKDRVNELKWHIHDNFENDSKTDDAHHLWPYSISLFINRLSPTDTLTYSQLKGLVHTAVHFANTRMVTNDSLEVARGDSKSDFINPQNHVAENNGDSDNESLRYADTRRIRNIEQMNVLVGMLMVSPSPTISCSASTFEPTNSAVISSPGAAVDDSRGALNHFPFLARSHATTSHDQNDDTRLDDDDESSVDLLSRPPPRSPAAGHRITSSDALQPGSSPVVDNFFSATATEVEKNQNSSLEQEPSSNARDYYVDPAVEEAVAAAWAMDLNATNGDNDADGEVKMCTPYDEMFGKAALERVNSEKSISKASNSSDAAYSTVAMAEEKTSNFAVRVEGVAPGITASLPPSQHIPMSPDVANNATTTLSPKWKPIRSPYLSTAYSKQLNMTHKLKLIMGSRPYLLARDAEGVLLILQRATGKRLREVLMPNLLSIGSFPWIADNPKAAQSLDSTSVAGDIHDLASVRSGASSKHSNKSGRNKVSALFAKKSSASSTVVVNSCIAGTDGPKWDHRIFIAPPIPRDWPPLPYDEDAILDIEGRESTSPKEKGENSLLENEDATSPTKMKKPKLKQLHLDTLPSIDGTIWAETGDALITPEVLFDDLEDEFIIGKPKSKQKLTHMPAPTTIGKTASSSKILKLKGTNAESVLDPQRAQNINIMLAKFGRKDYFDIAKAVEDFDAERLGISAVSSLLQFIPTEEERDKVRAFILKKLKKSTLPPVPVDGDVEDTGTPPPTPIDTPLVSSETPNDKPKGIATMLAGILTGDKKTKKDDTVEVTANAHAEIVAVPSDSRMSRKSLRDSIAVAAEAAAALSGRSNTKIANTNVYSQEDEELLGTIKTTAALKELGVDKAEQYIFIFSQISSSLEDRLNAISSVLHAPETAKFILNNSETILKAVNEIRGSGRFKFLLKTFLDLSNALSKTSGNKQSHGGTASEMVGFKLSSLEKITQTKSNSGETALRYVVSKLLKHFPEALAVGADMPTVDEARQVIFPRMKADLQKISDGLALMKKLIVNGSNFDDSVSDVIPSAPDVKEMHEPTPTIETNNESDSAHMLEQRRISTAMLAAATNATAGRRTSFAMTLITRPDDEKPLILQYLEQCERMYLRSSQIFDEARHDFEDLCGYFGEDTKSTEPEVIFGIISTFLKKISTASTNAAEKVKKSNRPRIQLPNLAK